MKTSWIVLLVAALALIGGIYWFSQGKSNSESAVKDTSAETSNAAPGSRTVGVSIAQFAFNPSLVSVKAGSTVTWTNNDSVTHTVTSDTKSFESKRLSPGQNYSHTFNAKGTFSYYCDIHGSMHGTVSVTP